MKLIVKLMVFVFCAVSVTACQKEVDWNITPDIGTGGTGGGGPIDTTIGTTNGELLVRARAISTNGADTNNLTLDYDANKRMIRYTSTGRSNGFPVDANYYINRLPNGNISTIRFVPFTALTGIDSIIYQVHYLPGTSQLTYATSKRTATGIDITDSTAFTYNAQGLIVKKVYYMESFIATGMQKTTETLFAYDARKNITNITSTTYNPIDGSSMGTSATSLSYDNHKSAQAVGEESFVLDIFDGSATSPNNLVAKSSGGQPSATLTDILFNSFDRPYRGKLTAFAPTGTITSYFTYYYQ